MSEYSDTVAVIAFNSEAKHFWHNICFSYADRSKSNGQNKLNKQNKNNNKNLIYYGKDYWYRLGYNQLMCISA